ncbi:MAG: type I-C CRISPR-associated protein Cas8c/Csd1 [Kiritimatiellae bacterium]|jgi:CRISPR-associated protein Csd1|nr:type I-C CRISPR-associated protein Cas8c/Csd1 [Kiritimatiellia bacterium]
MSWINKLYETYENNFSASMNADNHDVLLPICHTTQVAHIEVTIDDMGLFRGAKVISKEDSKTIVPCTEKSATRSGSKPIHHPLADKLQYLSGNLTDYGGAVTVGFSKEPQKPNSDYIRDLKRWCDSENSHWKACAVLAYVEKGTLIKDLVDASILRISEGGERAGKLIYQWESEEAKPAIFGLLSGKVDGKGKRGQWQSDAFVRWRVEKAGFLDSSTQTDRELQESWVAYYTSLNQENGLCFVTGKNTVLAESHPGKIRNPGDKAKLISSNDSSGFTYRGRFTEESQVCGVGFDVSQKAHNALRWLLDRQGWKSGDLAIVAWAVSGADIPKIMDNTNSLFIAIQDDDDCVYTAQEFGVKLTQRISGYFAALGSVQEVVVMVLDSATPGRMAIVLYRELQGAEFLKRVDAWHSSCFWLQRYSNDKKFTGAPSPHDIAKAAYGDKLDDKLKRATIMRLLPCILESSQIPQDIVESCIHRAVKRNCLDHWEWEKVLGITCAVYKHYTKEKENYVMALDRERKTRSYLFGRLLAVADGIEQWALNQAGEKRQTNAARLMSYFADHPCSAWRTLELGLHPYKARLGSKIRKHDDELLEIMNAFDPVDFNDDKTPLSGEFLLGFHCQRAELFKSSKENKGEVE